MIPMVPVFNGPGLLLHDLYEGPRVFRRGPRGHPTGPLESWADPSPSVLGTGPGHWYWGERRRGDRSPKSVTPESKTAPGVGAFPGAVSGGLWGFSPGQAYDS